MCIWLNGYDYNAPKRTSTNPDDSFDGTLSINSTIKMSKASFESLGNYLQEVKKHNAIFAERKEGKMVIRRGFHIEKGEKVLVVEDVITTGGSVKEVMNLVEDAGGNILGVGVLVDRSNGTVTLHNNQYSIVKLDAASYGKDEVPDELDKIPIQKPGSRHLI